MAEGGWEMRERERETVKVGGFGEPARLREHTQTRIKHWLYRAQTYSRGSPYVGAGRGGRETEEDKRRNGVRDRHKEASQEGLLTTVSNGTFLTAQFLTRV